MHWLPAEVPLLEDVKDWKSRLSEPERYFLTQIFRYFTQGDIDVSAGYVKNYLPVFPQPEVRMMLLGFAAREAIHVSAYSHLVETLGMPESTYSEFSQYAEMREKHDFIMQSMSGGKKDVAKHIAIFSAFTEGLQLFSSFIMLLNFTRHGKLKGMGQIISWSVADESLHTEAMIDLFRTYVSENLDIWNDELKGFIYSSATKMVELEDKFIDLAFSMGQMENLTADGVKKYIRYICDRRLISMGLKGIFKVKKNPLKWVEEMLNAPSHTNFFENKSTEYAKASLSGSWAEVWAG
jgi:ribonucleoside-diphosphate reductase beta chain